MQQHCHGATKNMLKNRRLKRAIFFVTKFIMKQNCIPLNSAFGKSMNVQEIFELPTIISA